MRILEHRNLNKKITSNNATSNKLNPDLFSPNYHKSNISTNMTTGFSG